jgi:hypothetical protein
MNNALFATKTLDCVGSDSDSGRGNSRRGLGCGDIRPSRSFDQGQPFSQDDTFGQESPSSKK